MNTQTTLSVYVRNAETVLFENKAQSVSSFNEKGAFDILPMHANLISLVQKSLIIREENGKITTLAIDQGIIHAHDNTVEVFLGIGSKA